MRWLLVTIALFAFAPLASGQSTECPANMVCISPEAARKALETSDALEAEKKLTAAKDAAINDLKNEIDRMRIEVARLMGEKSQMEQDRVRQNAIMDILIRNSRAKKIGLINF